jgi:hypothetical protein
MAQHDTFDFDDHKRRLRALGSTIHGEGERWISYDHGDRRFMSFISEDARTRFGVDFPIDREDIYGPAADVLVGKYGERVRPLVAEAAKAFG